MDEEKLIILVQGHERLYNLQHNDYDNNLVKDNCWKEIAEEWQGSGRVAAWERHGMCESAFNMAGERYGMCESAFNMAGERYGMCESAFTHPNGRMIFKVLLPKSANTKRH
jgi:hypothetical protein